MDQPLSTTQNKQCYKSILYVSIVILLFQGISNTELGIIGQFTSQNGQAWVGPLSTALLFTGAGLGALYNKYIQKMQYRYSFFIGSLGYTLFIGLSVIFLKTGFNMLVQFTILIGSFISGLTVSMFYNSQFNYVNTCSQIDKEETKYFGINMCIVQSCNIFGNFVSAILIEPVGQFAYAVIMNVSIFVISLFFLGVKNYKYDKKKSAQDAYIIDRSVAQQNDGQIFGQLPIEKQINQSLRSSNPQVSVAKVQQIPLRIVFSFGFTGMIISFIYCQLSIVFYNTFNQIYQQEELNRLTFIAFMIEGAGEFTGGLAVVFGQHLITKKIGLQKFFILITYIFLIALIAVYFGSRYESLICMDIASFVIGFCDCMSFTLGLTIAGRWRQRGITLFNIGQSSVVAITSILVVFVKFDYMILYSILVFLLSTFSVLTYQKVAEQNKKRHHEATLSLNHS